MAEETPTQPPRPRPHPPAAHSTSHPRRWRLTQPQELCRLLLPPALLRPVRALVWEVTESGTDCGAGVVGGERLVVSVVLGALARNICETFMNIAESLLAPARNICETFLNIAESLLAPVIPHDATGHHPSAITCP